MLIGLLHNRLDKWLARSSSKFEESGGVVTQPHGDVTEHDAAKLQIRIARKNAPVSRGVFAFSQYRPKTLIG
jgi:hypothetical protein